VRSLFLYPKEKERKIGFGWNGVFSLKKKGPIFPKEVFPAQKKLSSLPAGEEGEPIIFHSYSKSRGLLRGERMFGKKTNRLGGGSDLCGNDAKGERQPVAHYQEGVSSARK